MTEVDIHGMERADAKRFLERTLASLPPSEQELRVIHGYSGACCGFDAWAGLC